MVKVVPRADSPTDKRVKRMLFNASLSPHVLVDGVSEERIDTKRICGSYAMLRQQYPDADEKLIWWLLDSCDSTYESTQDTIVHMSQLGKRLASQPPPLVKPTPRYSTLTSIFDDE